MKEYRKKLVMQNWLFAISILVLIAVQILSYTGRLAPTSDTENFADFWSGFIAGVAMGLTLLFVVGIVINIRALRNEETLKKLYVKENDERTGLICQKGKSAGATVGVIVMLVGGIVCGYFSITASVTCLVCVVVLSLCMAGGKLYFHSKM